MSEKKNYARKSKEYTFDNETRNHHISIMRDQIRFYGIREARKMLYSLGDLEPNQKDLIWEYLMGDKRD